MIDNTRVRHSPEVISFAALPCFAPPSACAAVAMIPVASPRKMQPMIMITGNVYPMAASATVL